MSNSLLDAVDPDRQIEKAKEIFSTENPTSEQIKQAEQELVSSTYSIFDRPEVRNTLIDIRNRNEQIIDNVSKDTVIFSGFDDTAKEKPGRLLTALSNS